MFNPRARWDRRLPYDNGNCLDEKIWVWALFKAGKVLPKAFFWNNRLYRIKNITYNWQARQGQDLISYFSVDTETGIYQISFSGRNLHWRLNKIIK